MRKKLSKKQIGAMGLAAMMAAQTPAMAAETMQESAIQEAVTQENTQETAAQELQTTESQTEEASVETAEVQTEESESETQVIEIQTEEESEELQTQESEIAETQQTAEQEQEIATETSTEELIDQYALTETEEVLTEGWHQDSDGNYTYVKDGELVKDQIIQVDGKYYGFDQDGIMYVNTEFWFHGYHRAKKDGSLYINEWYNQSDEMRSYYGADGAEYHSGLYEIDGKKYYFEDHLCSNCCVSVDGVDYICREDGTMEPVPENSWITLKRQTYTNTYYTQNGKLLKNCVVQIDNNYYAFGESGFLYTSDYGWGNGFRMWNDETKKYDSYRAKKDGRLYVNEWYEKDHEIDGTSYYYYGEDGKAYSGFHEIDGVQYYFFESWTGGYMQKNTNFMVDGKNYSTCAVEL